MRVQVELPFPLRTLARVEHAVDVVVTEPTVGAVVAALEAAYPALRGTIRDPMTGERRPFLRFFAAQEDLSLQGMTCPLPASVLRGEEALLVIGAVAGGCSSVETRRRIRVWMRSSRCGIIRGRRGWRRRGGG